MKRLPWVVLAVVLVVIAVGLWLAGDEETLSQVKSDDGAALLEMDPKAENAVFKGGQKSVDYVVAHAETLPADKLLIGANTAYGLRRLPDACFLLNAGRVRARYDLERYEPKGTGGNSPGVALAALEDGVAQVVVRGIVLRPADYSESLKRFEAWNLKESVAGYQPGWEYLREVKVSAKLAAELKEKLLGNAKPMATLLGMPEYFAAFKTFREVNDLPEVKQQGQAVQARRKQAEETMRRIEETAHLKGVMRSEPKTEP